MIFLVLLVFLNLNLSLFPQINEQEIEKRKLEFEVSGGLSLIREHDELYSRISGNATLIDQYVQFYGLTSSSTAGEIGKIKTFIPLNLSLNYKFSRHWYLRVGFEYSSGKTSTDQGYQIGWNGIDEIHQYNYDYRLTSLMPFIGLGTRFSSFGIYANVGFNITDFTLTQNFQYTEGNNWIKVNETYNTRGKTVALTLGWKYMIKLAKKLKFLVKLEYLYLKIGSFSGEKDKSGSTSGGESFSESLEGTIYTYKINPYEAQSFEYWDLHPTPPNDPALQNIKELGIDLSCIRIMVGFSF